MKKVSYLFSLVFLMSLIVLTSCGDDGGGGGETDEEVATRQLTSEEFTVSDVKTEDLPFSDEVSTTLSFDENGTFSASNADELPGENFPASGEWNLAFADNGDLATITIGSLDLSVIELGDNILSFTYPTTYKNDNINVTVTAER